MALRETPGKTVKATVHQQYGSPDLLGFEDVAKPVPGDNEVLVKVRAASVNPLDWHTVRGTPYPLRIGNGFDAPKKALIGVDVAGQVEEVGSMVARVRPGDEVFGVCHGAFAEYACAKADRIALKPGRISFEQAAAIPVAGLTALQGLRDRGRLERGQTVLIVGASGGVGTFAVQIARWLGADVTAVCSTRNVELVRSIGANHVIDYTSEDFTRRELQYDVILDMAGTHPLSALRRVLTRRGTCVVVGAPSGRWIAGPDRFIKALLLSPFVSQRMVPFIASPNTKDLMVLKDLVESGDVTPVIDRTYRLKEVPEALRYLEQGHARGKVVITT
jgi:NADPH:quinone reductase-like Zn-dependent oxidoreductase